MPLLINMTIPLHHEFMICTPSKDWGGYYVCLCRDWCEYFGGYKGHRLLNLYTCRLYNWGQASALGGRVAALWPLLQERGKGKEDGRTLEFTGGYPIPDCFQ